MRSSQKILMLVEDSRDDAELIVSTLRDSEFKPHIIHVKDGAEALDYFFARTDRYKDRRLPHCILLDLKIPKIFGLEVLRQIRMSHEGAKIPVIVFTSSQEESDVIESYRFNVNSYLQKPIDSDDFEEAVLRLSQYWMMMNHYPASWELVGGYP